MNALLVYPRFPITYWGFQYTLSPHRQAGILAAAWFDHCRSPSAKSLAPAVGGSQPTGPQRR
jgi:hypothetical protein